MARHRRPAARVLPAPPPRAPGPHHRVHRHRPRRRRHHPGPNCSPPRHHPAGLEDQAPAARNWPRSTASGGKARTATAEIKTRLARRRLHPAIQVPRASLPGDCFAFLAPSTRRYARWKPKPPDQAGTDPDRISFTVTIRIARDHASGQAIITPLDLARARQLAVGDLLADLLPRRRDRQCQRVSQPPKNTFPSRKRDQPRPASQVTYTITINQKTPSPARTP